MCGIEKDSFYVSLKMQESDHRKDHFHHSVFVWKKYVKYNEEDVNEVKKQRNIATDQYSRISISILCCLFIKLKFSLS